MKKFLYLIPLFFILSSCSYSQWWVNGGNLLWPYGDVSISKNFNVDGDINAEGIVSSSQYKHIILFFFKSEEDGEFDIRIYRNDTQTTIDTAYWSGGSYGTQFIIKFSGDIYNPLTHNLIYFSPFISSWSDTGSVPTQLEAHRWASNDKIQFRFIDSSENPLDLFFGYCYIDLIIVPATIIDHFYFNW